MSTVRADIRAEAMSRYRDSLLQDLLAPSLSIPAATLKLFDAHHRVSRSASFHSVLEPIPSITGTPPGDPLAGDLGAGEPGNNRMSDHSVLSGPGDFLRLPGPSL